MVSSGLFGHFGGLAAATVLLHKSRKKGRLHGKGLSVHEKETKKKPFFLRGHPGEVKRKRKQKNELVNIKFTIFNC